MSLPKAEGKEPRLRVYTGRRLVHSYEEAVVGFAGICHETTYGVDTDLDTVRAFDGKRPLSMRLSPCMYLTNPRRWSL